MRQSVRSGLTAAIVVMFAAIAGAQAPSGTAQPKQKAAAPAPTAGKAAAKPAAPPARPAILDQVLATVNGEPITRGDLINYLNNFGVPPGAVSDEEMYSKGIEGLANFRLVNQYMTKQNPAVTEKEIDGEYNGLAEALKKDGQDINVALASSGISAAQVREEMKKKLRWRNYVKNVATDAVLTKYVADNKDVFNRTQVRASHIVLRTEPNSTEADKAKMKQKLAGIKKEIDGNKISFADAANKYSEDEGNKVSPSGGDLGYFTRRGQFDPSFTAAAFALKKGSVSDPVETPFGYHLIQVTDRKEGEAVKFDQQKPLILNEYETDLQERIVNEMRKTAKIDVKPMPADLFPKAPQPTQGPATEPGTGTGKAAPKAATPPK